MLNASVPPGRSTRAISRIAPGKSGPSINAIVEITASNESALKFRQVGIRSALVADSQRFADFLGARELDHLRGQVHSGDASAAPRENPACCDLRRIRRRAPSCRSGRRRIRGTQDCSNAREKCRSGCEPGRSTRRHCDPIARQLQTREFAAAFFFTPPARCATEKNTDEENLVR